MDAGVGGPCACGRRACGRRRAGFSHALFSSQGSACIFYQARTLHAFSGWDGAASDCVACCLGVPAGAPWQLRSFLHAVSISRIVLHAFLISWELRMHSLSAGDRFWLLDDKECMRSFLVNSFACGTAPVDEAALVGEAAPPAAAQPAERPRQHSLSVDEGCLNASTRQRDVTNPLASAKEGPRSL